MDWDNLRYFLELSRAGRLTAAARRLGVDHTTVARRVQALEKSLGRPLFLRSGSGYSLTEAGRRLSAQAEAMESAFLSIEQEVDEGSGGVSGLVRIGATEGFGVEFLAGQLAGLTRLHPDLHIDLLAVPRMVRLARHEADIAITLERPERGPYIITRLTDYSLRLYASADYLDSHAPIRRREDLREHGFVSYIEDLLYSKELTYFDEIGKPGQASLRSTSILAQLEAAKAGAGLAILPNFAASHAPGLQQVLAEEVEFIRTFWMLMPVESKDIARMRVTWDFLREAVAAHQGLMMGR
ncbi:LysR family transcriptional regulator [Stutzerimonas tarimensis]|uniref:LysR family transcriptional regulator n=1 Tax=Stutzerimonas tarimensis TaxID=1507735 RepID=A0ABV7T8A0_9GAMM